MYRNGGLFLEKISEQDREYFQRELKSHENIRETFSLSYRVHVPPADKIVYLLDVRTPIITTTNKILGFDGGVHRYNQTSDSRTPPYKFSLARGINNSD